MDACRHLLIRVNPDFGHSQTDMCTKVLMLASVASMIDQFNMANIAILQKLGCEVHVATNFVSGSTSSNSRVSEFMKELEEINVIIHDIPFPRKIGSVIQNCVAYKAVKRLINDYSFSMIHLHSPIGGAIGRLAAIKARKKGMKVIYTAHGFHFFQGAPLINWIVAYPIEWILSFYTDILVTINKEDYKRAFHLHAIQVEYIPGVGVDTKKYDSTIIDCKAKKKELGIPDNVFILLSVGELCKRKNHETIVKALSLLQDSNIYYLICGKGEEETYLKELVHKYSLDKHIIFLGYRTDIKEIVRIADCFVFPSKREGLGIAAIEAMSIGLPIITSNVNGILDYSENGKSGYTCSPMDISGFANAISNIKENQLLREMMGYNNIETAKKFDISCTNRVMERIYSSIISRNEHE